MIDKKFRIGWLVDLNWISEHVELADLLIDYLHIDTLWLESSKYHTAGYSISDELWHQSPFFTWKSKSSLQRHRTIRNLSDQAYPLLPGIMGGADDSDLIKMIGYAKKKNLKVWGHLGLWSYGGMVFPEFSVRDVYGNRIDEDQDKWGSCFCPNHPKIHEWIQSCLDEISKNYDLDGIQIDHARYPPPNSIPNLWGCACNYCVAEAKDVDIDLISICNNLITGFDDLRKIPSESFLDCLAKSETIEDFINQILPNAIGWFNIRAQLLCQKVNQYAKRLKSQKGPEFEVGIDVFPPSISLFGGHLYEHLTQLSFLTGGFGLIGWEQIAFITIESWVTAFDSIFIDIDKSKLVKNISKLLFFSNDYEQIINIEASGQVDPNQVLINEIRLFRLKHKNIKKLIFPPLNLSSINMKNISSLLTSFKDNFVDGVVLANIDKVSKDDLNAVKKAIERNILAL